MSIFRKSSGSTLVEVMVASAIGMGLVLAITNSTVQTQKQIKKMTLGSDWTNALNLIKIAMSNSDYCKELLMAGGVTTLGPSNPSVPLTRLGIWNASSSSMGELFKKDVSLSGFYTKSIQLVVDPNTDIYPVTISGVNKWIETRYINLSVVRNLTSQSSTSGNADLFSGMQSTNVPTLDMIQLTITESSTYVPESCQVVSISNNCPSIENTAMYNPNPNAAPHVGHNHTNCQINSLNINPNGSAGGSADSKIYFGERFPQTAALKYDFLNVNQTKHIATFGLNSPGNVSHQVMSGDYGPALEVLNADPANSAPTTLRLITANSNGGGKIEFANTRSPTTASYSNYLASISGYPDSSGKGGYLKFSTSYGARSMDGSPILVEGMRLTHAFGNQGGTLEMADNAGDKITLMGERGTNNFGFGRQPNLMQIHTDISGADIAFGWGHSASMTETMRIKGDGKVGIGTSTPSNQLEIAGSQGKLSLGATGWVEGYLGTAINADTNVYKSLMIVGNNVPGNHGRGREVSIWDFLWVVGDMRANNAFIDGGSLKLSDGTITKSPGSGFHFNSSIVATSGVATTVYHKSFQNWGGGPYFCDRVDDALIGVLVKTNGHDAGYDYHNINWNGKNVMGFSSWCNGCTCRCSGSLWDFTTTHNFSCYGGPASGCPSYTFVCLRVGPNS